MEKTNNSNEPVAFVTGASSGFGLLTSVALAQEGYRVIASMRNLQNKGKLVKAANEKNVLNSIEFLELDVTHFQIVESIMQDVISRYGKIDLLINNAGYAQGGFTEELSIEQWRLQHETNFLGMVAVTRAVLPVMRIHRSGKIINMSSISGRIAFPSMGPYAASKFAVEGFSESLRLEMKTYNVHVVLIEPASYKTKVWSKGMEAISINPDSPYINETRAMLNNVNHIAETAQNPDEVVDLILKVSRMDNPKLRYAIGKGVHVSIFMKSLLPWHWWESIIIGRLKKGTRGF